MRKIKINNIVHDFDMSDGKGNYPFGMSGVGSMDVYIGKNKYSHCFVENKLMLDGEINYKHQTRVESFDRVNYFVVDDLRYEELKNIHTLTWEKINDLPLKDRIENILFGLKYFDIEDICNGYRFGKELTFKDFCITFDSDQLVVFASSHNGYVVADYLELNSKDDNFKNIIENIKHNINRYFDFEEINHGK